MDQKIKDFWNKLNSNLGDLWNSNKLFVIIFGVLILIVKFRNIIINLLIENSKEIAEKSKEKEKELVSKEEFYKKQSDILVQKAKDISKNKSSVKEDWYKNEK